MKMTKIAAGSFKELKITIDKQGGFKAQWIRNGQTQCHTGSSDELTKWLNTAVPGYAVGFGAVSDAGKTSEFYEQNRPKVAPPQAAPPEEEDSFTPQQPTRKLDQGYGV